MMKKSIRESREQAWIPVVAALVMTLSACGGDATSSTSESSPAPATSVAPAQASPTPSAAAAAVIPNLTQAAALKLYLDNNFDCKVMQASHPTWTRHRCTSGAGSALATADFEGPGTAVASLKASTIGMPDVAVEGFLGDTASLPFAGAASDQAQQWVTDSVPKGSGNTVIGGVHLQLLFSPPLASVTLKPAT